MVPIRKPPEKHPDGNGRTRGPRVSVIVPVYNPGPYLRPTLKSILSQDYPYMEVILVDDASRENIHALSVAFQDPRIRYVRNRQHQGIAASRNRGFRLARGKYVTFFDQDDLMLPGAIRKRARFLEASPQRNVVCGYTRLMPSKGLLHYSPLLKARARRRILKRVEAQKKGRAFARMFRSLDGRMLSRFQITFALLTNLMMRRELFSKIGGFDPWFKGCDDVDFVQRVARRFPIYFLDVPIKKYRMHLQNASLRMSEQAVRRDWKEITRRHFQVERQP